MQNEKNEVQTQKQKPIVKYYRDTLRFQPSGYNSLREIACCFAIDHPYCGTMWVGTTPVISKNPDGSFETRNTIYVPSDAPRPDGDFTKLGGEERCNSCGMTMFHISARLSRHAEGCSWVKKEIQRLGAERGTVHDLRQMGYAVVLFNPDELNGVNPIEVENCLVERGNEVISTLGGIIDDF